MPSRVEMCPQNFVGTWAVIAKYATRVGHHYLETIRWPSGGEGETLKGFARKKGQPQKLNSPDSALTQDDGGQTPQPGNPVGGGEHSRKATVIIADRSISSRPQLEAELNWDFRSGWIYRALSSGRGVIHP